ncbi:MAG: sensor histidine kinase [Betaproteobacteria bacterium]|nr:MAG: sensor histidine kinase [Betaproteobacteria bacterium]
MSLKAVKLGLGEFATQRSLIRRVCVTLVLTTSMLFCGLFFYIYQSVLARDSGELDRTARVVLDQFARQLNALNDVEQMRLVAKSITELQRGQGRSGPVPSWKFTVSLATGEPVFIDTTLPLPTIASLPPGSHTVLDDGNSFRVFVQHEGNVHVWLVDKLQERSSFLAEFVLPKLLGVFFVMLPCLVLPVWLAVRSGLAPLNRLSTQMALRSESDLSPIELPTKYKELSPLVTSLNQLLRRVDKSIGREKSFVHDAAHELRTPLAVILAQAHVLADAETHEHRTEAKTRLENAVSRASHLTRQMLDLARMDGRDPSIRSHIDVMLITRNCVADQFNRASEKGVELTLEGPETLWLSIDEHVLQSILENLLDNALRYGASNGKVTLTVSSDAVSLYIAVCDNGPGIAPHERAEVFERFRRGQAAIGASGAGLGLSIVSAGVNALGGRVSLGEGIDGKGCGFYVQLPASPHDVADASRRSVAADGTQDETLMSHARTLQRTN